MVNSLHVVILAGGKGERFWPMSTPEHPKPFLRLFSDRSLLQQTFDRARRLTSLEQILLVVGESHERLVREQIPELQDDRLLLEPAGRDTAAAIGYASIHLPEDALMLVLPADHLIPDEELFNQTILSAAAFLDSHGGPGTFGIPPSRPETNYGYILAGTENLSHIAFPVYSAQTFVEKPDRNQAAEMLRQGSYYWNSGIFLWKVRRIQELIARHLPELWKGLQVLSQRPGDHRSLYEQLPRISIDYGVMQKADRVVVIPARFRWDDIGTWNALTRILPLDAEGNLVWGTLAQTDTKNCILYSESHTIVTAGLQDLVIVQSGNRILICHKDYADRLKEMLSKIPK